MFRLPKIRLPDTIVRSATVMRRDLKKQNPKFQTPKDLRVQTLWSESKLFGQSPNSLGSQDSQESRLPKIKIPKSQDSQKVWTPPKSLAPKLRLPTLRLPKLNANSKLRLPDTIMRTATVMRRYLKK